MHRAAAVLYPQALATSITLPMEILQAASQMARAGNRGASQVRFLLAGPDRRQVTLGSGIVLNEALDDLEHHRVGRPLIEIDTSLALPKDL